MLTASPLALGFRVHGSSAGAGSWGGTLLDEGKRVLATMAPLLRGPTRVLKVRNADGLHADWHADCQCS